MIGDAYKNVTLAFTLNALKFDLLVENLIVRGVVELVVNSLATACEITNILDSIEVLMDDPVRLPNTPSPATVSDDNVPTEVILGCAAVLILPTKAVSVFPIVLANIVVAVIPPLTANPVKVPTEVILACELPVTKVAVPATTEVS